MGTPKDEMAALGWFAAAGELGHRGARSHFIRRTSEDIEPLTLHPNLTPHPNSNPNPDRNQAHLRGRQGRQAAILRRPLRASCQPARGRVAGAIAHAESEGGAVGRPVLAVLPPRSLLVPDHPITWKAGRYLHSLCILCCILCCIAFSAALHSLFHVSVL